MSISTDKLLPKIKRYFRCLWAALRGRCLSLAEGRELKAGIVEAKENLVQMQKLYYTLAEKWSGEKDKVKQQEQTIAKLQADIIGYQKMIETLRNSVRDKDHDLTLQRQQYLELMDKQGMGAESAAKDDGKGKSER